MKKINVNKFPYQEALSNFYDEEFERLAEAVRTLFFRRLKHFPLAAEIGFKCAMHIVTTTEDREQEHCFPVAVFSVDKEIESALGPGNPSVSTFLMDCISDVFRGQRAPNFIGIVAEKPNAE